MTIKEAEKLTGLTSKSIRFYEEKKLINIERNAENDYRTFTEEDIKRLKLIKILRYLDFSIEDIKNVFKEDNLKNELIKKINDLEKERDNYEERKFICESLLKDYKKKEFLNIIDNYSDTINFLESEDAENLKITFLDAFCPNISAVIIQTLIFIAPIIWLFINIYNKNWDAMLLNSIVAIISTIFIIIEWTYYLNYSKNHKEITKKIMKEKNKNNSLIIPVLVVSIIIVIILFVLLNIGLEYLIAPSDYLFFETPLIISKIMIFAIVFLIIITLCFLLNKFKINKTESLDIYLEIYQKCKYILVSLFIIITYIFITSNTFVTKDKIIYHSPFHPFGITYDYEDVKKIETGFGNKSFSLIDYNRKGEFYYRIYIEDKKITFSVPSTNSKIAKYENDSYLELEEFDNELKKYNIKKVTNDEYAHLCNLDKEFCDRFLRIINN